jgi:hypothetical protein
MFETNKTTLKLCALPLVPDVVGRMRDKNHFFLCK